MSGSTPDESSSAHFPDLCRRIVEKIGQVLAAVDPAQVAALVAAILGARRTFVYGAGRGGLVMRGLVMGNVYEQALWVLGDALVVQLQTALDQDAGALRARHTNLE
jgi:D-arabinose 5-phosphate isomerase GutQ